MKKLITFALVLFAVAANGQSTVTGYVYEDSNQNDKKDQNEKGIAEVAVVADHSDKYQMNIFAPKVVPKNQNTSAGIYVNFFMGTKGDEVKYRVGDGKWRKMRYHNDYDPSYLHLLHEWGFSEELMRGKRLPDPERSTHLWRGNIPTRLETGKHTIEVKATDMFGRTFTDKKSYRIEASKN